MRFGDRRITITGIELTYWTPEAEHAIREADQAPGSDDVRILLSHRPDTVLTLPPGPRTDLVVAGHTHGGQISIPGHGPLLTLTQVPRSVAAGGLHDIDGRAVFVSTGVGMERGQAPPVRLFVNPTVAVVTLE